MGSQRQSDKYSQAQKKRRAKQTPEELSAMGTAMITARWAKTPKKKRIEFAKKIRNGTKS